MAELYKQRDSLHVLPLSMIPLHTHGLSQATLIRNARLETVVELFKGPETGSGQIAISSLPDAFPSYIAELKKDIPTLNSLSRLSSFDVYSLRLELRRLGIPVDEDTHLCLSPEKRKELAVAMSEFTRPLIQQVYGGDTRQVNDIGDIVQLLTNPDRDEAMRNLQLMSEKLRVDLHEIPDFIEEYGDIFLSLAYFKHGYEEILPDAESYLSSMRRTKESRHLKDDTNVQKLYTYVDRSMKFVVSSFGARLEGFQSKFKTIWGDINRRSFNEIKDVILSSHQSLGGVLCGLSVKMRLWRERFPNGDAGPSKMAEFTRAEILPGLERVERIERSSDKL